MPIVYTLHVWRGGELRGYTQKIMYVVFQEKIKNKEERYSRVPRLSDTRYSKGNGDMEAAKRN